MVLMELIAHFSHQLCGCIGRTGLAARTGILDQCHAAVNTRIVAALGNIRIVRVKRIANVRGQASRALDTFLKQRAVCTAQICHQCVKEVRLHTGHTVRTDFFLVDQNDHRRLFRRFFEIQQRRCRRI